MTTRDKMLARKKQLESRGNGNGLIFPKEGVLRVRMKSPGDDQELGIEVIQFYLNREMGGIISPATFGEPCPFMEISNKLRNSSNPDDKELAKTFIPRHRYVIGGIVYADEKGTKVDYEGKDKGILITRQVYQDITELYLDEDEAGDMTDPINGYDIKIKRAGSGQFDTTYSAVPCKPTKLDSKYRGLIDLEGIVRSQIKPYDELEDLLNQFLNEAPSSASSDDDDEDIPKKSKDKKKKKKYKSDI